MQVHDLKENIDFQTAWGTYLKMMASGSYIPLGRDSKYRTAYSEEEGVACSLFIQPNREIRSKALQVCYTCDAEMEVTHGDFKINMETPIYIILLKIFKEV